VAAFGRAQYGANNQAIGMYGVVQDITSRKETELALAAAQEELRQHAAKLEHVVAERTAKLRETIGELEAFSYSIAHDMRAPLRAMQGFSQLLNEECGECVPESGKDYLRRITTSAKRMDRLIQDVLNYSRVARTEISGTAVDLDRLLGGILESYPQFQPPKVVIEVQHPLPTVLGSEASLTQVFSNLLGNAAKFVAPGVAPRIVVRAEERNANVRVWVEDNGIGIEADQHENIFGIFQRLEKDYDGTGIGLAIVKKAVERMHGTLGLESSPGKGSKFWFELPKANQS
jgi:signal transduction histidine kinase